MKIQYFLEKINSLKNLDLDTNTELENLVSEIVSQNDNIQFLVEDLFRNESLNYDLLSKIEKTLNLIFIKEEKESFVCFANSEEIRSEYKQSFRLDDLLNYIFAFTHTTLYKESPEILLNCNPEIFWQLVKIGQSLKNDMK